MWERALLDFSTEVRVCQPKLAFLEVEVCFVPGVSPNSNLDADASKVTIVASDLDLGLGFLVV